MSETEPGLSNLHTCRPLCRFWLFKVLKPWPGLAVKPVSTLDLKPWGSSSQGLGRSSDRKGKSQPEGPKSHASPSILVLGVSGPGNTLSGNDSF